MRTLPLLLLACTCTFAGETKLGAPLALKHQTPIADLIANPADYVGKAVQVKGKVTAVCENMGCWMMLADPSSDAKIRIKVKDGEIVFPKSAAGKMAVAEGKMVKIEMTKEQAIAQAKHEAEERGTKFDASKITGPQTIFQIAGTGAVILE
jgi:hypothetical protein